MCYGICTAESDYSLDDNGALKREGLTDEEEEEEEVERERTAELEGPQQVEEEEEEEEKDPAEKKTD